MSTILLVDDDTDFRDTVKDILEDGGFRVIEAPDGRSAVEAFRKELPDVVLLDLRMPQFGGMEALRQLQQINSQIPVIIQTAYGDIPTAVEAMKEGAYDFVAKPPQFDILIATINRALEKRQLQQELSVTRAVLDLSLENLLGKSAAIKEVIKQIYRISPTDISLIIQGETGTGKTVIADTIHKLSPRNAKPFVRIDIGLVPDLLIESELYGYKKGAFTGAASNKTGYFESADGGTIFIDELENVSPQAQVKLLNFLDRKEICPVGGTSPIGIDVRVIAATNRNIQDCIKRKEIREDLYYRLGESIITLPPLRERLEDVPFFANKFLSDCCTGLGRNTGGISAEGMRIMQGYSWPGNLREMKNIIRQAVLASDGGVIDAYHIEQLLAGKNQEPQPQNIRYSTLREEIKALEKKRIGEALEKTSGNKTRAAEILKISYKNICEKIKEYEIG